MTFLNDTIAKTAKMAAQWLARITLAVLASTAVVIVLTWLGTGPALAW